jgi:uncharacterized membrane protein YkgB
MFWLYHVLSAQAVSNLIGIIEVSVAILIALGPFSALLFLVGSLGAILTFLLTISFLLSTLGAIRFRALRIRPAPLRRNSFTRATTARPLVT